MPINQPTTYLPRNNNRNYVNVSGAIIGPLGQALGGMAAEGIKDMFGIYSPGEEYTRAMAGNLNAGMMDKANQAWLDHMANDPQAEQHANDPEYKRRWLSGRFNVPADMAEAWASTSLNDTPVTQAIRNQGNAAKELIRLDQMPTQGGGMVSQALQPQSAVEALISSQGGQSPTPAEPTPLSAQAPITAATVQEKPPAPPPPVAPAAPDSATQSVLQALPETPEALKEVATPAPTTSKQEVVNADGVPIPQSPAPQKMDQQQFRKDLQAYMIRQGAYAQLYTQTTKAALTGTIDPKQLQLAAQLGHVQAEELTKLMNHIAPSIGLSLRDNNNTPLTGSDVQDGASYNLYQRLMQSPEALEQLRKNSPKAYDAIYSASERFRSRMANMDAEQYSKFMQDIVNKSTENSLLTPQQLLVAAMGRDKFQWDKEEAARDYKLREQQLANQTRLADASVASSSVATQRAEAELAIFRRYSGPQAEAELEKVRQDIRLNETKMKSFLKAEERADIEYSLGTYMKMLEQDNTAANLFATRQERQLAALELKRTNLLTKKSEMESKFAAWNSAADAAMQKYKLSVADLTKFRDTTPEVKQWMEDTYGEKGMGDPHNMLEAYHIFKTNDVNYKSFVANRQSFAREIDHVTLQQVAALEASPPSGVDAELKGSASSLAKSYLQSKVLPGLKARSREALKGIDPSAWDASLQDDPTLVNHIVGEWTPNGLGTMTNKGIWDTLNSRRMLELVRSSPTEQIPISVLEKTVIPGQNKTLMQIVGPNRWAKFYNDYTKLRTELQR